MVQHKVAACLWRVYWQEKYQIFNADLSVANQAEYHPVLVTSISFTNVMFSSLGCLSQTLTTVTILYVTLDQQVYCNENRNTLEVQIGDTCENTSRSWLTGVFLWLMGIIFRNLDIRWPIIGLYRANRANIWWYDTYLQRSWYIVMYCDTISKVICHHFFLQKRAHYALQAYNLIKFNLFLCNQINTD